MKKPADHLIQIQLYPAHAFAAGFTCYMPFGCADNYDLISKAANMEKIIKGIHRTEEAIINLK